VLAVPKTERGKQYDLEYIKTFQRQFMLKCNRKTEPELVEWLESKENVQTYLKELIRKDIENSQK
jgi:hypothetical protein